MVWLGMKACHRRGCPLSSLGPPNWALCHAATRRSADGILTRKLRDVTLNQKSMSLSFRGKLKGERERERVTEEINFGGMEGLEGEGCSPHCAPSRRPLSAAAFPTKGRARTRVGKAFRLRLAFQNVSCEVHAPKNATVWSNTGDLILASLVSCKQSVISQSYYLYFVHP